MDKEEFKGLLMVAALGLIAEGLKIAEFPPISYVILIVIWLIGFILMFR